MDPSLSASQAELNAYMTPRDKNDWTNPSFRDYIRCTSGTPSPSYAHDGRGMAWTLWNHGSAGQTQGFNDYMSTDQSRMSWSIVRGIRATGAPVGIIAARGMHAILAVGYRTALDPLNDAGQPNEILGFRVWDPWYGAGFGSWSGWPAGGFSGNSYIAISDWNSVYFTPDRNEGPYYDGKYVAVMRSSVAEAPSDSPAMSYGDWVYAGQGASAAASTTTSALASDSIEVAVAEGLLEHDLLGDPELGDLPAGYTLGNSVRVASLDEEMPAYHLVEVVAGAKVRAVALVRERDGGYLFGELRPTVGGARLPTQAQLQASLAAHGLRGTASLSWAWTRDPVSPFAPFLTGISDTGRQAFVTPRGVAQALPIVRGLTPRSN
jgi:hypothetical protein